VTPPFNVTAKAIVIRQTLFLGEVEGGKGVNYFDQIVKNKEECFNRVSACTLQMVLTSIEAHHYLTPLLLKYLLNNISWFNFFSKFHFFGNLNI
jgi:hypothetical protein